MAIRAIGDLDRQNVKLGQFSITDTVNPGMRSVCRILGMPGREFTLAGAATFFPSGESA